MRHGYMPFLVRFQRTLLLSWLVVLAISVAYGPAFFSLTKSDFSQPPGTPSYDATAALFRLYPSFSSWPPAFVIHTSSAPGGVLGTTSAPLSQRASVDLQAFCSKHAKAVSAPYGYWELASLGPAASGLAMATVSGNNRTMRTTISFLPNATITAINKFADDLLKFTAGQGSGPLGVAATGLFPLFSEMTHATEENFILIDAIVLPIAVVLLGAYVKSYRHMGLALLTLAVSLLLAFAVLVPIARDMTNINPFAPSIMLSLGIAVCFDYTLFAVTRFKEEITRGAAREDAVFNVLATSGHVILLSGGTLALTFVLLLFFPQNFLNSVGISCSAVVIASLLSNLSIIPALLLYCDCLSKFDLYPTSLKDCGCSRAPSDAAPSIPPLAAPPAPAGAEAATPSPSRGAALKLAVLEAPAVATLASPPPCSPPPPALAAGGGAPARIPGRSMLFHAAWAFSGKRGALIVLAIVCGITVPFFLTFLRMQPSSDDYLIYLQGSASLNALSVMKEDFSLGSLDPYNVLIDTGIQGGVFNSSYFAVEGAVVSALLTTQPAFVGLGGITGLTFFDSAPLNFSQSTEFRKNHASPLFSTPRAVSYRANSLRRVSSTERANLLQVETLVNPNSQGVIPFIVEFRKTLDALQAAFRAGDSSVGGTRLPGLSLYLIGGYTATMDIQDALYTMVPAQIALVFALVLIIVTVAFWSLLLTLRLLYTIFVSLAWTYGLMVLVYQPGPAQSAFAVLTPTILSSVGVYWIIPLMSFSILVGLALDYDIFLVARMVEFRKLGWSDRAAVSLAIEKTGSIISIAGLIMVVSFAGLLIPKTIVLNQCVPARPHPRLFAPPQPPKSLLH